MQTDLICGIGTDITECQRVASMLERHAEQFISRVFTPREIAYCQPRRDHVLRFTGRWAAKEAVLKALGTGWTAGITWQDVEILNADSGEPRVTLSGGAQKAATARGIEKVHISISHCDTHAVAFAIATSSR